MWLQAWVLSTWLSHSPAGKDEGIEGWLPGLVLHKEHQGIRPRFGTQHLSARGKLRQRKQEGRRGRGEVRRSMMEDEEVGASEVNMTGWCETIEMKWEEEEVDEHGGVGRAVW